MNKKYKINTIFGKNALRFSEDKELRDNIFAKVKSFNDESNIFDKSLNKKIKYIIVGTLTPFEGRKNGYFYASNGGNAQIDILNKVFPDLKLADEYKALAENKKDKTIIQNIKNKLSSKGICFLDVVKEAYSPNIENMPNDELICPLILDYENFEKALKYCQNPIFICNSHAAEDGLTIILDSLNVKERNIVYIPQISQHESIENRVLKYKEIFEIQ